MTDVPQWEHQQEVMEWAQEGLREGRAFQEGQNGYDKIDTMIRAILGDYRRNDGLGGTTGIVDNKYGEVATNLAALLTDVKPFWEYSTFDHEFDQQASIANKRTEAWWFRRNIDLKFNDVIKYCLAAHSGYAHLTWDQDEDDEDLIAEDPRDVIPIRPSSTISIQDCDAVCLIRERTVNYLKRRYPKNWLGEPIADLFQADRDASLTAVDRKSRAGKIMQRVAERAGFLANVKESIRAKAKREITGIPTCDVFTLYVKDGRKNETAETVEMGPPGASWSYQVKPGAPLYPRKRLILFTNTVLIYDGPSHYMHGLFPCPKLTLDSWPFGDCFLGKSPLYDLLPIYDEYIDTLRTIQAHRQRVRKPGVIADANAFSKAAMDAINTELGGMKLRHKPAAGKPPQLQYEPPLDPAVEAWVKFLSDRMEGLSGVRDLSKMTALGQIPSAETVEKIFESMSSAVRARSRSIEAFFREVAFIHLSNMFQFDSLEKRVAMLGVEGMTFQDFDADPGTLIPNWLGPADGLRTRPTPRPRHERAIEFISKFRFHVSPGSLLSASHITEKLLFIQLFRMGVLDIWTMLQKLNIPNIGEIPEGSIADRLKLQKDLGIGAPEPSTGRKPSGQKAPRMSIRES